jgi:2-polyprenyl-3-methyl-5-hydroxy-6-metoxy-1,4-benzoquinol methylase
MKFFKKQYDKDYFNTMIDLVPKYSWDKKVDFILSYKNKGKLLEIGFGNGILLKKLSKYFDVFGLDISEHNVKKASKIINNRKLFIGDIEKINTSKNYDVMLAFDVLEHLNNPAKTIKKIYNMLKKNGIFIFSVPNNYGLFGKISTLLFNFVDRTHRSTYKRVKWIKMIKEFNLECIDIINENWLGFYKNKLSKHFAYNLLIVCRKNN